MTEVQEWEEEEHSFLMIWETEDDIENEWRKLKIEIGGKDNKEEIQVIFRKSMDLLIRSILNNNNIYIQCPVDYYYLYLSFSPSGVGTILELWSLKIDCTNLGMNVWYEIYSMVTKLCRFLSSISYTSTGLVLFINCLDLESPAWNRFRLGITKTVFISLLGQSPPP